MDVTDTSDVQAVEAIALKDYDSVSIQCDFITGSNAQGCMVVLVGESDNSTVNITRGDSKECAVVKLDLIYPLHSYHKVIGFDIEADGSVGTLAVPGVLTKSMKSWCLPPEMVVHPTGQNMLLASTLYTN